MKKRILRYFKWHLLISIITVTSFFFICQFYWFPFIELDGIWVPLLIIIGIDITLGPLLTLLLISPGKSKRERLIDMTLIAIIQISALLYGLFQIEKKEYLQ